MSNGVDKKLSGGKAKSKTGKSKSSLQFNVQMNSCYEDPQLKNSLRQAYVEQQALSDGCGLELHSKPFQCCQMQNVISDQQFLEDLRDELLDEICYEKNNDLYKFHQTNDFRKLSASRVSAVRKFFVEDFRAWMTAVTGIIFTDRVDLTSSKYEYTDVLLCHDDELDTRRIAFAFYLVPTWTKADGGLLDLYDMDENGQPKNIVLSLVPAWNSLSWFEVTEASHHQVSEVLSKTKTRLSVHGWYHTAPVPRAPRYIEALSESLSYVHIEEEMVYEWLNPIYLDPEVQAQVREKFGEDSEIELQGFLKEEKYQELTDCLMDSKMSWSMRGPPNKRNYQILEDAEMPEVVRKCIEFFRSEAVFLILSNLTGLRLHRLAPKPIDSDDDDDDEEDDDEVPTDEENSKTGVSAAEAITGVSAAEAITGVSAAEAITGVSAAEAITGVSAAEEAISSGFEDIDNSPSNSDHVVKCKRPRLDSSFTDDVTETDKKTEEQEESECNPKCRFEVRKWRHGGYTLVHDTDLEDSEFSLDAVLYCLCKGWQKDYGGYTSYISKGEDLELLTIYPDENSLALVYRDKDTARFVKHVNHRATESQNATEFFDVSFIYYE